jgi:signal peptidase
VETGCEDTGAVGGRADDSTETPTEDEPMTRHDTDDGSGPEDSTPSQGDGTLPRRRAVEALAGVVGRDHARTVGLVLLVAVVVPFVVFAVPQVVGAEQSYVVLSGSMEPAIPTGSAVIVERASPDAIERGDVITFEGGSSELTTTHRVVEVRTVDGERRFRTKGDNNEDVDPRPVPEEAVVGRVMELSVPGVGSALFVIPFIGYVVQFAKTTVGFGLLVVLPFALLVASELREHLRRDGPDGTDGSGASSESSESSGGASTRPTTTDPSATESSTAVRGPSTGPGGTPPRTGDSAVDASADTRSDPDPDDGLLTVPMGYVTVGVGLLAAAGTFVGQRAVQTQDPVAATAAVGALTACVLLCGLALSGGDRAAGADEPVPSPAAGSADRPRVVDGTVPERLRQRARIGVDSRETLVGMAAERDVRPVRDAETGEVFLFDDGVAYVASPADTGAEPSADAAASRRADDAPPAGAGEAR